MSPRAAPFRDEPRAVLVNEDLARWFHRHTPRAKALHESLEFQRGSAWLANIARPVPFGSPEIWRLGTKAWPKLIMVTPQRVSLVASISAEAANQAVSARMDRP